MAEMGCLIPELYLSIRVAVFKKITFYTVIIIGVGVATEVY